MNLMAAAPSQDVPQREWGLMLQAGKMLYVF